MKTSELDQWLELHNFPFLGVHSVKWKSVSSIKSKGGPQHVRTRRLKCPEC